MMSNFETILEDQLQSFRDINPSEIQRNLVVESFAKKATILTGIRRSGKSTFLKMLVSQLTNKPGSLPPLYVTFFDERLIHLKSTDLNNLLESYAQINDGKKPRFIILDEIQVIHGWEVFVARLIENTHWKVFLTGSSSKLLGKEIATQMRGRSIRYELFPFSFREFLEYKNVELKNISTEKKGHIKKYFLEYITWGGFPEIISVSKIQKRKILNEYFEVLLFRDIIERNKFERTVIARRLFVGIMKMYGNLFSINQTHKKLKAEGISIDKNTLAEFIRWCEDAYVLFTVHLYSKSEHVTRVNPQKLYICDMGLAQACETWDNSLNGKRFENLVYLSLRSNPQFGKINYYLTTSKYEVDFLFQTLENSLYLIQVCWELNLESKNRELRALEEAMLELNLEKSYIVTFNQSEVIKSKVGTIYIINILTLYLKNVFA